MDTIKCCDITNTNDNANLDEVFQEWAVEEQKHMNHIKQKKLLTPIIMGGFLYLVTYFFIIGCLEKKKKRVITKDECFYIFLLMLVGLGNFALLYARFPSIKLPKSIF